MQLQAPAVPETTDLEIYTCVIGPTALDPPPYTPNQKAQTLDPKPWILNLMPCLTNWETYCHYGARSPKNHQKDGLLGPSTIMAVYVDTLGLVCRPLWALRRNLILH